MENSGERTKWLLAFPIFLTFFVMGFGDAVGTLVGFVQKEFSIAPSLAGLLPFFGFLAYAIFSVPIGILQDRKGKKFVLVTFLGLVLLGELIPVISIAEYYYVLIAIFLIGSAITGLQVAGNPIMRDVSPPGLYSRNLTAAQFVKGIGSMTAPFVITIIVALGFLWHRLFLVFAFVVAVTFILTTRLQVKERADATEKEERATMKSTFALLKRPYVLAMVLAIFFYVGAEVGMSSWIASHLKSSFGFDIERMATIGIGFFFAALTIGRLFGALILNKLPPKKFLLWTSICGLLGVLGMFVNSRIFVLVSIFIAGLGFGNIFPLIFSIIIDKMPERSNELSGLMNMAIVGGAIVPAIMGVIADYSVKLSFILPALIFAYIVILAVFTLKKVE